MRIDVRDAERRRVGRVEVDPGERPTRVRIDGAGREIFLRWDGALDDGGHLRRCVVCGGSELFSERAFPQITGLVVVLAFAGAVVGVLGVATTPPVLIAMTILLIVDVAILTLARKRLVCYRCRSSYHDLAIARYHKAWERSTADRCPPPAQAEAEAAETNANEALS